MKINHRILIIIVCTLSYLLPSTIFAEDKEPATSDSDTLNQIEYDTFGFRFKKGRISALKKYGGSEETEQAVIKALRWLKENQNKDGSWGDNTGISGLALLAFLGHGETPASERYGECVKKAIDYLVSVSKQNKGYICNSNDSRPGYTHGIASFAMAEAYGLTRDPKLREVMNDAILLIVQGQNNEGGFDYRYANSNRFGNRTRSDLSVGGWNMQAMSAAKQVSCDVKELNAAIDKAVKCVKSLYVEEASMFAYDSSSSRVRGKGFGGNGSESLTGVGTLCLAELEGFKSQEFTGALKYLLKNAKCDWDNNKQWPIYMWYYQTLTFFKSEQNWNEWNKQMSLTLVKHQFEDGHWEEERNFGVSGINLKVYSTALCALMLEVYYRYYTASVGASVKLQNKTKDFEEKVDKIKETEKPSGTKILLR